ncbi:hypothetical protein M438DRAFT_346510 [Aureobasidium pullulans EXF-150]|uniref:Uncharacterized protein n=1 Tax=Aureobasidium pullulans EXF-150 TaxID=1043002 RepID=A0A074XDU2_AURPU|nr:uncharacterized protein M438DRAFT_346510 [Aureobasidium pullulans EXF-150]KEQ83568.1 hypothetical protein M438DRAFT_346510 [Aureobasidium pullulans EXF-150]
MMTGNYMRCRIVNRRPANPPKAGMSIEAAPAEDVDEAEEEADERTDDEPAVEEAEILLIDEPEEPPDDVDEELKLDPEAVTLPLPLPAANTELVLVLVMTTTTDVMGMFVATDME